MAQPLYVLLKTTKPNPIFWENQGNLTFETLKGILINLHTLGHPNYQLTLFLFVYGKEGNFLKVLAEKHGGTTNL